MKIHRPNLSEADLTFWFTVIVLLAMIILALFVFWEKGVISGS